MRAPEKLVACAGCGCHVRSSEPECPLCGARLRHADGSIQRTAVAMLLGLSAAAVAPIGAGVGCGGDVETSGGTGSTSATSATTGNTTTGNTTGGQGGFMSSAAAYGVASSGGLGGMGGAADQSAAAAAYGVPLSDDDMDGYFDATEGGDDCDDSDAAVHPGAPETPGDGKDSNCDGDDDT